MADESNEVSGSLTGAGAGAGAEGGVAALVMSNLDRKITDDFSQYTVRKDLVSEVKGNALVPSYVLEYLLSKYATTTDQESINAGVKRVRDILADNYVHREEANLIQSKIREKGRYQVIDKVQVALNEKLDRYEATFENLGISRVVVDSITVDKNPKLLVTGIWCMCTLVYAYSGDRYEVPWRLHRLMPVQMSHDDRENYLAMRAKFTAGEWIDLLMQSVGFNPDLFGDRAKLLHLVRMIPFVERNYNLIELGPKGKKADKALVDIMKNCMANKSFSRGTNVTQAEASMVFVGNTSHNVPYMLKNSDLFEELPVQYHDPAFLDRIHYYLPGWEFEQIRTEMFTSGYGFVVDYLAEILHNLRNVDYGSAFEKYFKLSPSLSTRDKDGVRKTFSGLMKLIYPSGQATAEQMEPLLRCAIEGRKRVKDQLCRIDSTMAAVDFSYTRAGSVEPVAVHVLEEDDYPELYWRGGHDERDEAERGTVAPVALADDASLGVEKVDNTTSDVPAGDSIGSVDDKAAASADVTHKVDNANETESSSPVLATESTATSLSTLARVPSLSPIERAATTAKEGHVEFAESQRGATYNKLFGPYVAGATQITLKDPYIRKTYQVRNLAEFLETVYTYTNRSDEVHVHLITGCDEEYPDRQIDNLSQVQATFGTLGIALTYEFSESGHDRSIVTDTGWRVILGRGLDIYQRYSDNDWLNPLTRQQKLRRVKEFSVTYQRR